MRRNGQGGTAIALDPSPPDPLRDAKAALRRAMRARRLALPATGREAAARAAAARVMTALAARPGKVVSAFLAMRGEIDTMPLIEALLAHDVIVALPRVTGRGEPLAFHAWRPGEPLEPAPMGMQEPPAGSPTVVPSALVVPLLAFDRQGNRLGYGGGFYDRTLAALRARGAIRAVGLAFEAQRVEAVPAGPGDERLDLVATEAALHAGRMAAGG